MSALFLHVRLRGSPTPLPLKALHRGCRLAAQWLDGPGVELTSMLLAHPPMQHALLDAEVPRNVRDHRSRFLDQLHCVPLELVRERSSRPWHVGSLNTSCHSICPGNRGKPTAICDRRGIRSTSRTRTHGYLHLWNPPRKALYQGRLKAGAQSVDGRMRC